MGTILREGATRACAYPKLWGFKLNSIPEKWDRKTEVLIVGTGFAGLSAAIEAYDAGASVLLLEKMPKPGGTSVISGGGANAVDPERQIPQGIEDSVDLHFKHTFEGGDQVGDPEKIRFIVENTLQMCIKWLKKIGVEWDDRVTQGYGALWERTHIPLPYKKYKRGVALVHAMLDQVKKRGILILLRHRVTKIIREKTLEEKVLGVEVQVKGKKLCFKAEKAVVLASGGFGANLEMVVDHDRRLANTDHDNWPGATGECIKMAQDIGAHVVGMDYIQCCPWKTKPPLKGMFFMITSEESRPYLDESYKVFVDKEGNRFVREDGRRDEIQYAACAQQPFEALSTVKADAIEELEKKLEIPKGNLAKTIEKYNSYCDMKHDPDFCKNRNTLLPCRTPPFQGDTMTMMRHHTMGGLKVRGVTGQVIDRWEKIIPHLYAAGEVTGGTHGTNRLGYNAIPECIVFGRTVGRLAATVKSLEL